MGNSHCRLVTLSPQLCACQALMTGHTHKEVVMLRRSITASQEANQPPFESTTTLRIFAPTLLALCGWTAAARPWINRNRFESHILAATISLSFCVLFAFNQVSRGLAHHTPYFPSSPGHRTTHDPHLAVFPLQSHHQDNAPPTSPLSDVISDMPSSVDLPRSSVMICGYVCLPEHYSL